MSLFVTSRRFCRSLLAVAMLLFLALYLHLTFTLYERFAYNSFDLGIFHQAVWLISQGETPFVTVRGVHVLGDHFSALLYLLAPLYRLSPSPKNLLFLQTCALTLGAIPAYALARKRLQSETCGLLFGLVYLLHPAHQWSITYEFHPDTFGTPFLLTALYALEAKRFRLYAIALVLLALIKESAGLTVACVGLWAFFKGTNLSSLRYCLKSRSDALLLSTQEHETMSDRRHFRTTGGITVAFGILMLGVSMLIIQHFNQGQPSPYFDLFRHFGSSPEEIARNFAHQPLRFLKDILSPGCLDYFRQLIMPLCFLPLLAPEAACLALPMLLVNIMASRPGMHGIEEHYNAFITPFLFLGTVIGFERLQHWGWFSRWAIRLNLPLWAITGIFAGPLVRPVDTLYSTQPCVPAIRECSEAVSLIPEDASVSAQFALGAHLSRRREIYTFPNPFVQIAYGGTHQALSEVDHVGGTHLAKKLPVTLFTQTRRQAAEYIVLCPLSSMYPLSDESYHGLVIALLQSRCYETRYVGRYVMILQRTPSKQAQLTQLAAQTGKSTQTPEQIDIAYWHWLQGQYIPNGVTP